MITVHTMGVHYRWVARSALPNDVQRRIDRRRDHAAPGKLRELIKSAALRDGVTITIVPAAELSRTHAHCGHINPSDDRYLTRPVPCDGCGDTYDPDDSATALMMRAVHRRTSPGERQSTRPVEICDGRDKASAAASPQ